MADVGWGGEPALVIAVGDDAPLVAMQGAIAGFAEADAEPSHTAGQAGSVAPLDDEMGVVLLHRVVDDEEAVALADVTQNAAYDRMQASPAQTRGIGGEAHGHKPRAQGREAVAQAMRDLPKTSATRAAGARARAAAESLAEAQLRLRASRPRSRARRAVRACGVGLNRGNRHDFEKGICAVAAPSTQTSAMSISSSESET